jgi:hypothetical protein
MIDAIVKKLHDEVRVAINLSNNKEYIDCVVNLFRLDEDKIKILNELCAIKLQKNLLTERRKYFIKNFNNLTAKNNYITYNFERQKFIFNLCMNVIIDEEYIKHKYVIKRKGSIYQLWLESLIFSYIIPNEQIKIDFSNKQKALEILILGEKLEPVYKKIFLNDEQKFVHETIKNSKLFDEVFYLCNNKDVEESEIEPSIHYSLQGYKEKRNPSILFNNDKYIIENNDVQKAGVNPLYHYLVAGKKEGRKISNISEEIGIELNREVKITSREKINDLEEKELINKKYEFIIITHDNIKQRTGGVQKVIKEEMKNQSNFLILAPTTNKDKLIVIDNLQNKEYIVDIKELEKINQIKTLIIHSMLNFDSNFFINNILIEKAKNIKLWAHDYSILCTNFLLLRNNYQQCGAPKSNSSACEICVYNESRKKREIQIKNFFLKYSNKIEVITPSEYAQNILIKNLQIDERKIKVREHIKLINSNEVQSLVNEKIKVAYVGSNQSHKGFSYFFEIMNNLIDYDYYLFSENNFYGTGLKYIPHSTNSSIGLEELIQVHNIDIVILPSTWEETFCITAYESLAGGAEVYCFERSGNLSKIKHENLKSFNNIEDMQMALLKYKKIKKTKKYFKILNQMDLEYAQK